MADQPTPTIQPGDRVHISQDTPPGYSSTDSIFEVVAVNDPQQSPGKEIGVRLPESNPFGHSLDGQVDEGFGWWTRSDYVVKAQV